ncbi:MAG: sulfite exporter TauE/SafE family protein [Microcoleaceae cyanobacterium]
MIQNLTLTGLDSMLRVMGQVTVESEPEAMEDAAMLFSGPQFFTALVAGVILAFAFQLLMTNLGVAIGISALGGSTDSHSSNSSSSNGLRKIGMVLGLGTLISVTIALFFAALFAVKLSLFVSPMSGAIMGLVIWGTYFCLMVWVSSTTAGSLIGSVVNTATSGFQALFGTAMAAIGAKSASQQVVRTAEAAAGAVRNEFTDMVDPVSVREKVEDYIYALRSPDIDIKQISSEFETILNNSELLNSSDQPLPTLDRETIEDLVSSRSDLSKKQVRQISKELEKTWNKKLGKSSRKDSNSDIINYLKSATRDQLLGSELSKKLDDLTGQLSQNSGSDSSDSEDTNSLKDRLMMSFNSMMGLVMGRTDLSDLDVEKISSKLQKAQDKAVETKDKAVAAVSDSEPKTTVRADIENYLLNSHNWQLKDQNIEKQFREVIYDRDADPAFVAEALDQINRSDFVDWLSQKGLLTQEKIDHLATLLDGIRLEALAQAQAAHEREMTIELLARVEDYLLTTPKTDLTPEKIQLNFKPLLKDTDASHEQLMYRLEQLDRPTFERLLEQRSDLSEVEISVIINDLELAKNQALKESQELNAAVLATAETQWLNLQSYLRDTGRSELNPQAIERELKLLVEDPKAGSRAIRARVSRFNRDTLLQLLSQRGDVDEAQVNQIINDVERTWTRVRYQPQRLAGVAQQQYEQAQSALTDYLRSTGKPELNPEGIQRDLKLLLDDPKLGAKAVRRRLAKMDRDTLVQLLTQRKDLSEDQVNQTIDQVQETLNEVARSPKRLARRTQQKAIDFKDTIADYLRSTDKAELSPAGIERDVKLLLNDPQAGMESLKLRLSHFDRNTLVALLSQREDVSEEEVQQIVDQMMQTRDQVVEQLQMVQQQIQSVIDRVLDQIRDYLNSLDRPELNYEGVRRDFLTLFDDPQAGFDALQTRLSQFDRNTLVALMSSRDDISEADANRIIDQAEMTRTRVLQKAERFQRQAQLQVEQAKKQAEQQLENTRKAASVASWWLFITALVSAIAAAGAGALGVTV